MCSVKRKFLKSIVKDSWKLLDTEGNQYGELIEDSIAILRRFIPLIPAKFHFEIPATQVLPSTNSSIQLSKRPANDTAGHPMDRRMVAAIALLNSAIEGEQG